MFIMAKKWKPLKSFGIKMDKLWYIYPTLLLYSSEYKLITYTIIWINLKRENCYFCGAQ